MIQLTSKKFVFIEFIIKIKKNFQIKENLFHNQKFLKFIRFF